MQIEDVGVLAHAVRLPDDPLPPPEEVDAPDEPVAVTHAHLKLRRRHALRGEDDAADGLENRLRQRTRERHRGGSLRRARPLAAVVDHPLEFRRTAAPTQRTVGEHDAGHQGRATTQVDDGPRDRRRRDTANFCHVVTG